MANYAEFIIGPAEGRTRWLFSPKALRRLADHDMIFRDSQP
jgi:hypothetical protein